MHSRAGEKCKIQDITRAELENSMRKEIKESQRVCEKIRNRTPLANKRFARPSFRVRRGVRFLLLVSADSAAPPDRPASITQFSLRDTVIRVRLVNSLY